MIKKTESDLFAKTDAFRKAYERCDWGSLIHNSGIARSTRKEIASNEIASEIVGGAVGVLSVVHPNAPDGSDLAPSMQESYVSFRWATGMASTVIEGAGMLRTLRSMPRPPGPPTAPATGLVVEGVAAQSSASATSAVTVPEPPIAMAMASTSRPSGPTKGTSGEPKIGENVGQLHPKTGHEIIAEVTDETNKIDVNVEVSKPSQRGQLTKRLLENPGTHDPSSPAYKPNKAVMPADQVALFRRSVEFEGKRYAMDAFGNIHQFQPSVDNVFHWAGSENAKTAAGVPYPLEIPPGVRALFRR
jgi:hypothetical protein